MAVRGVPNRAENTPAMPHSVASGRSFSPRCRSLPVSWPMPPPICSAAPSRPALPPAQVRKHCGQKNNRHQLHRYVLSEVDGFNDGVRALAPDASRLIEPHNHKSRERQQIEDPRVAQPLGRRIVDADVEQRSHKAADRADQCPEYQPFGQHNHISRHVLDSCCNPLHRQFLHFLECLCPLITRSVPAVNRRGGNPRWAWCSGGELVGESECSAKSPRNKPRIIEQEVQKYPAGKFPLAKALRSC